MFSNLPDYLVIQYANTKRLSLAIREELDEELEWRYESIKEELKAYEKFEAIGL